jgi:type IV secretory pathway VirB10-like protein
MRSMKTIASLAIVQILTLGGTAWAQGPTVETTIQAQLHVPEPYELTQGTFINLTLERVDPNQVSAMVFENVYDAFENIVIPRGSRLFGRQVNIVNDVHDVYFDQIQLNTTGKTYTLQPPLQATTPLGAAGIVDFKPAATAGTMLRKDLVIPH